MYTEDRPNPQSVKRILKALFILVLVWGLYGVLRTVLGRVLTINPTIGAALVAGLVAIFGYLFTQYQTKSRDIAEAHRSHKVEVYGYLLDIIELMATLAEERPEGPYDFPENARVLFAKFNRGVIAWGAPEVIYAWLKFRSQKQGSDAIAKALVNMDSILHAIRRDLGNKNYGLSRGDLISLFFKNPEDIERIL